MQKNTVVCYPNWTFHTVIRHKDVALKLKNPWCFAALHLQFYRLLPLSSELETHIAPSKDFFIGGLKLYCFLRRNNTARASTSIQNFTKPSADWLGNPNPRSKKPCQQENLLTAFNNFSRTATVFIRFTHLLFRPPLIAFYFASPS